MTLVRLAKIRYEVGKQARWRPWSVLTDWLRRIPKSPPCVGNGWDNRRNACYDWRGVRWVIDRSPTRGSQL